MELKETTPQQESERRKLIGTYHQRIKTTPPEVLAEQLADADLENQGKLKELNQKNKRLEESARKDGLTGIDNRRTFEEEIRREIRRILRTGQPISIIMADIDNFKIINDIRGHLAGDEALRSFATILQKGIRQTDRVCRYGGEEFVIILPDTNLNHANGVTERLRRSTEASKQVTASFGVTTFFPEGSYPPEEELQEEITENITQQLLGSADDAMYAAKRTGKNKTGFMDYNGEINILEKSPTNSNKMVIKRYQRPPEST